MLKLSSIFFRTVEGKIEAEPVRYLRDVEPADRRFPDSGDANGHADVLSAQDEQDERLKVFISRNSPTSATERSGKTGTL